MTMQGLFDDFLDLEPRATFFSFRDQFGPSQGRQKFFSDRFSNIFDMFQGDLAGQVRQGEDPTLRFTNFLEDFNFDEFFGSTAPSLRGGQSTTRFAPPTRFLF